MISQTPRSTSKPQYSCCCSHPNKGCSGRSHLSNFSNEYIYIYIYSSCGVVFNRNHIKNLMRWSLAVVTRFFLPSTNPCPLINFLEITKPYNSTNINGKGECQKKNHCEPVNGLFSSFCNRSLSARKILGNRSLSKKLKISKLIFDEKFSLNTHEDLLTNTVKAPTLSFPVPFHIRYQPKTPRPSLGA